MLDLFLFALRLRARDAPSCGLTRDVVTRCVHEHRGSEGPRGCFDLGPEPGVGDCEPRYAPQKTNEKKKTQSQSNVRRACGTAIK
eukprot:1711673-Rhodomonas_salina.1